MPTRETTPAGDPVWIDVMSSDPERTRAFYAEVLGWEAAEPNEEFGGYFNFTKDGRFVGGGMPRMPETPPEMPDVWSVYMAVDDAEKTVEAAAAAGGTVVAPPMAVADLGTMAIITDPTGATFGIWQAGTHKGFGVVGDPDTPGWFELHTRDHDAAVAFYRDALGWDTHAAVATPELTYTTLGEGDDGRAGIMAAGDFLPEGVPSHWRVYFTVTDTDATVAKATGAGATVVMEAVDTPYGRLAALADPTGANFALLGPNKSTPAE